MNRLKEFYLRLFNGYTLTTSSQVQDRKLTKHPERNNFEVIKCREHSKWGIWTSHYLVKESKT